MELESVVAILRDLARLPQVSPSKTAAGTIGSWLSFDHAEQSLSFTIASLHYEALPDQLFSGSFFWHESCIEPSCLEAFLSST